MDVVSVIFWISLAVVFVLSWLPVRSRLVVNEALKVRGVRHTVQNNRRCPIKKSLWIQSPIVKYFEGSR